LTKALAVLTAEQKKEREREKKRGKIAMIGLTCEGGKWTQINQITTSINISFRSKVHF
jgi:hypothetical protein